MNASPTIYRQRKPEVASVAACDRSSVSVKIVGNMIALHKPTASAAQPLATPLDAAKKRHRVAAIAVAIANSRCAGSTKSSADPAKRPIIAPRWTGMSHRDPGDATADRFGASTNA